MENSDEHFGWVDYSVFSLMLIVPSLIGIYYWRVKGNTGDYLLGNKNMGMFPITMSLTASSFTAGTLLGTPTEIYLMGSMLLWMAVSLLLSNAIASWLYLPIFHELQIISTNHYLEQRFNSFVRRISSIVYILKTTFYLAIVVYGPALVFSYVSGIHVYVAVTLVYAVCLFYTFLGGMKAVVWSDTLQVFVMYGAIIAVLIKGVYDIGGFGVVWQRSIDFGRLEMFNVDLNPTTRYSVWSVVIGGSFFWTAWFSTDQMTVQRFLALPTLQIGQLSMMLNGIACFFIQILCCSLGLVMYAKYFDCDPYSSGRIEKTDQTVARFVMETVGSFHGLPGLYVSGVFSAALSTLSSGLNSLPIILIEDFVRPFYPNMTQATAFKLNKAATLTFGLVCFCLVFLAAEVKTILEATFSIEGAVFGVVFGVYTLGMFNPWANSTGASVGMIISTALMVCLCLSAQAAKSSGFTSNPIKSLSTDGCLFNITWPVVEKTTENNIFNETILSILSISYLWYTPLGYSMVVVIGTIVSIATKVQDPKKLDPRLMCDMSKKMPFLPAKMRCFLHFQIGDDFGKDIQLESVKMNNQLATEENCDCQS